MPLASNVSFKRGSDTLAGQWHALWLGHVWVPWTVITPFFNCRLHGLSPCTLLFFLCLEVDTSSGVLPQLLTPGHLFGLFIQRRNFCVTVCDELSGPGEMFTFHKMYQWI